MATNNKTGNKKPTNTPENPGARDSRGAATRKDIRSKTANVSAPRASQKPMERSNQKRAHGK